MKRLLEPDLVPSSAEAEESSWTTLCDDLVRAVVAAAPEHLLAPMFLVCQRWHKALERDSPQAPYWRAWFRRKPGYSLYEAGDPARPYATSWKALVRMQPMLQTTYFARFACPHRPGLPVVTLYQLRDLSLHQQEEVSLEFIDGHEPIFHWQTQFDQLLSSYYAYRPQEDVIVAGPPGGLRLTIAFRPGTEDDEARHRSLHEHFLGFI
jgi:hypothetical protein